jgi:hypothetical protein
VTHIVITVLAICAAPWAIGLATLGVARWLDAPSPATLELTDDTGATHHVEALS